MDVLKRIIDLREERHWTEYRIAEEAEMTQSTISAWYRKKQSSLYSFSGTPL